MQEAETRFCVKTEETPQGVGDEPHRSETRNKLTGGVHTSWINDDAEKERLQVNGVQRERAGSAQTKVGLEPGHFTFQVGRVRRGADDRHNLVATFN